MGTNEFYYNGDKQITMEEAHALEDKSTLIVSNLPRTKTFLSKMVKEMKEGK